MSISIIRDPGSDYGVSVVIASNEQGRIEPFILPTRKSAEMLADRLDGNGAINIVLIYHGIEMMTEKAAQRFMFGLKSIETSDDGSK